MASPLTWARVGVGLQQGEAVGQGGVRGVVRPRAVGEHLEPHRRVDLGRQAVPEGAEEGVEVGRLGVRSGS